MAKQIRGAKIVIDIPEWDSSPRVQVILQSVTRDGLDGEVIASQDSTHQIYRGIEQFYTESFPVADPVTEQPLSISGGGIVAAITALVRSWIQEELDTESAPSGDQYIKEE